MTFTNFLQVLAFNLLSSTIPLCLCLYFTVFLIKNRLLKVVNSENKKKAKVIPNEED